MSKTCDGDSSSLAIPLGLSPFYLLCRQNILFSSASITYHMFSGIFVLPFSVDLRGRHCYEAPTPCFYWDLFSGRKEADSDLLDLPSQKPVLQNLQLAFLWLNP